MGLSLSQISYQLETSNESLTSNENFFGFKLSGAGWGLLRAPLELNFNFSPSAPSSFDSFTTGASGFVAFLDLSLPFEWVRGLNWSVYWTLGVALSHFDFSFSQNGEDLSSGRTEFGGVVRLGGAHRLGGLFVGRLEASYHQFGEGHLGFGVSVQRSF